jgi:uncharacterized protein YfaP (DUF2135 family)
MDAGGSGDAGVDAHAPDVPTGTDAGPPADSGMCPPAPTDVPYADRIVNEEFTDPPVCSDCPGTFTGTGSLDVGMIPPGATTIDVSGAAAGASMCEWWVVGGACGVTHGSLAVDPDGTGVFEARLPVFCGTNVIRIICSNTAGRRVLVRRIEGTPCEGRDLRLTIAWDELGDDWELHLVQPGGRLNDMMSDCTWFTCMGADGLDWGTVGDPVDNPRKDVDDLDTHGPENIYLERAPPGTYHVFVEHWGTLGTPSTGSIDVTIREATVAHLDRTMFATHHVWHVGTVTFPAGTFTPIDTDIDCTSNFMLTSRGCDLMLP